MIGLVWLRWMNCTLKRSLSGRPFNKSMVSITNRVGIFTHRTIDLSFTIEFAIEQEDVIVIHRLNETFIPFLPFVDVRYENHTFVFGYDLLAYRF